MLLWMRWYGERESITFLLYVTETFSENILAKFTIECSEWFDMVVENQLTTALYVTETCIYFFKLTSTLECFE